MHVLETAQEIQPTVDTTGLDDSLCPSCLDEIPSDASTPAHC